MFDSPGTPNGTVTQPGAGQTTLTPSVEQLYVDHAPMVWRGLRRLGVTEESIEDAMQDVFVVAHRRIDDFEGRSSVKSWLYGIALRVAKDYRRARKRRVQRTEALAAAVSANPESARTPHHDAERREANRILHAVLSELREPHREIFVLVELEDLSVKEAAAVLHVSIRSCQRRLRAAQAAFEKKAARYAHTPGRTP